MAKYNLNKDIDLNRFKKRLEHLIKKGALVELTDKSKSLKQNNYFHVIVSFFALEYGETADYIKREIVKKTVCPDIFITEYANTKTGEIRPALKSWSELGKEERGIVIDRFRNWAIKTASIYLPEPHEHQYLKDIQVELSRNQQYL